MAPEFLDTANLSARIVEPDAELGSEFPALLREEIVVEPALPVFPHGSSPLHVRIRMHHLVYATLIRPAYLAGTMRHGCMERD